MAERRRPDGYRLSAYDYWQFWRNTADADVAKFGRLFTDLPLDEIARLEALQGAEINQAKIVLATEATALLHGREAADAAAATARGDLCRRWFGRGAAECRDRRRDRAAGSAGRPRLLRVQWRSQAQGRRRRGKLDGEPVSDIAAVISVPSERKLSLGKKKHGLLLP